MKKINVAIVLFDEVEVLDFAGPFEVFSIAADPASGQQLFRVTTIAERSGMITARNGLRVEPDTVFTKDTVPFDLVIVPGGKGAEEVELHNTGLHEWLVDQKLSGAVIASVCTGAFILAGAGLLDEKQATTHWLDIDRLQQEFPKVRVTGNTPYIDQGKILTSGGIASGIRMSLYLVERMVSSECARITAKRIEFYQ